jgi:hypothetical protein
MTGAPADEPCASADGSQPCCEASTARLRTCCKSSLRRALTYLTHPVVSRDTSVRVEIAEPSLLAELADITHARWLVVIQAYADESEKNDLGVFTVAGYCFTPGACGPFERQWRKALALRSLSEFKTSDFMAGRGEFKGWSSKDRTYLYKELTKIIYSYAQFGIGQSMDTELLKKLRPKYDPYILITTLFCMSVMNHVHSGEPVSYILDEGRKGWGMLTRAFDHVMNHPEKFPNTKYSIHSYSRVNSKDYPQSQAADMLAWRVAWEAVKDLDRSMASLTEYAWELFAKTPTLPSHTNLVTGSELEKFVQWNYLPELSCCGLPSISK